MGYSRILGPVSGGVSSWNDLTDKPSTFAPSSHTHPQSQVTAVEADLAGRFDLIEGSGRDPVGVVSGLGYSAAGTVLTVEAGTYTDSTGRLVTVAEDDLDFSGETNGSEWYVMVEAGVLTYEAWTSHLPDADQLPLYWVTKGASSLTVVDVANRIVRPQTEGRTPFAPIPYKDLLKVASGAYANGWKKDPIGTMDGYFSLPLAWALAERETADAKLCCERFLSMWNNVADASKVPVAYGTDTWLALHGTTHAGAGDPGGFTPAYWPWRATPADFYDFEGSAKTISRADSHDSYAAWLVKAMVRIGRVDTAWWDSNFAVLKEVVYYNLLLPLQNVGGGYLTSVFQDKDVYAYCLVGDNCEVWRALADLCAWITEHANGTQTTWLSTNNVATARDNIANGIHSAWHSDADPANEYLHWYYEIGVGFGGNDHSRYYPEMWVYLMPLVFRAPLYSAAVNARTLFNERMRRIQVCLDKVAQNAPYAGRTGRYGGVFPYEAMWAAAFASIGLFDEARECVASFKRNRLRDGAYNYVSAFDVAWIVYAEDCIGGVRPDAMGEWFA